MRSNGYDVVIVGAGLFGATCAYELHRAGLRCLVVERRSHIGGNCYTEPRDGINVHRYGPHIFHTSNRRIWDWINQFAEFNNYRHRVQTNAGGKLYSFPPNLTTFRQLWNVQTTEEAHERLVKARVPTTNSDSLEDWALSQVGEEIYNTFIKGYTQKQWGRHPSKLPASIIRRIPVRLNEETDYFSDIYQGIPIGGYTPIFTKLLRDIDVALDTDYFARRTEIDAMGRRLLYTGPIDRFFDFRFGRLAYRSLRLETKRVDCMAFQDVAQVNYPDLEIPYTRIIEHKHFEFGQQPVTWITREYPCASVNGCEPFYPVKDAESQRVFDQYQQLSKTPTYRRCYFGGRLGGYQYYDMHQVIAAALKTTDRILAELGVSRASCHPLVPVVDERRLVSASG